MARPNQGDAPPWGANMNAYLDVGHNADGSNKLTGGGATKVIAPSDAPTAFKNRADIVLPGSADQVAINALLTAKGDYKIGPGNVNITDAIIPQADGITIEGAGMYGSTIVNLGANKVMFDYSGSLASQRVGLALRNMKLNGNGSSHVLPLIRNYYGYIYQFDNLWIQNCGGSGMEGVQWWDSRLRNLWFDNCGLALGATTEALRIVGSKEGVTAGNFGYSTDNCNNIWMRDMLWTSNRQGDMYMGPGGGSSNQHRIYGDNFKFENQNVRNAQPAVKLNQVVFSAFRNWNMHPVSFDSGQSTAIDQIDMVNSSINSWDHIMLEETTGMSRTIFKVRGGCSGSSFKDVLSEGTALPTVADFEWLGTNNNIALSGMIDANHSGAPTSVVGTPIKKKAGAPVDSDFPSGGAMDGHMVLDTTNHRLYVRDGGVWKYATLT